MKELVSISNPVVKAAADLKQKKHRQAQKSFLVEGLRSVDEAMKCGKVRQLFVMTGPGHKAVGSDELIKSATESGAELYAVSEQVMKKIADTESPQILTAVAAKPSHSLENLQNKSGTILVLDRISDPGNLGTIIRTADASGIDAVVLLEGCTDAFAPKAVRATMGSVLHVPIIEGIAEQDLIVWASSEGYELLATCLDGAESLYTTKLKNKIAIVIGSEAVGVSDELLKAAKKKVYIPMDGQAESLNAAVAAGVVMFECLRQRLAAK